MLVDVSHVVEHGMVTYKGLPAPLVCDFLSREQSRSHYAPGTEFHIGKIEMVANTGTYLDAPFHRYADGNDLAELPLERLAEPGRRRVPPTRRRPGRSTAPPSTAWIFEARRSWSAPAGTRTGGPTTTSRATPS